MPAGSPGDRRLPGDGAGPRTDPQCMRCGIRVRPHRLTQPIAGSQLSVCAPGYGCKAGDGHAVDLDDAVRAVLGAASAPLGPQAITAELQVRYGISPKREALERALYRVGERVGRGQYRVPAQSESALSAAGSADVDSVGGAA